MQRKVYQAKIREFLWKTIAMESTEIFVTQTLDNMATLDT